MYCHYLHKAQRAVFFSVGCCALVWASVTYAQITATSEYLHRMDADGDGRISLVEYQDWMSYAFDAMDKNHDGNLSAEEQPGGRGKILGRDEHRARLAERFKRQDLNRDGYLNSKELASPPQ